MNLARLAGLVPWALLLIGLAAFPVFLGAAGLLFLAAWGALFLIARSRVEAPRARRSVPLDIILVAVCFLGLYLGGWYVLPAAIAFAVADMAGLVAAPPMTRPPRWVEAGAGIAALAAGVVSLAFLVQGRPYAAAGSTVDATGAVQESVTRTISFADANDPRALMSLALVAALAVAAGVGAVGHVYTGRDSFWFLLGGAALGLAVLTVLSSLSIGPSLAPAAVLAGLAWWLGRRHLRAH